MISFIGLPGDEQRQGFISQLQLEVFAWIKRNPAVDRPLGGLLVMDEAQTIAPSGSRTASTQSTILLASQARKYGLGLRARHAGAERPAQPGHRQRDDAVLRPAEQPGADRRGERDGAGEGQHRRGHLASWNAGSSTSPGDGFGFRRMRAPLCLSHHPPGPLRLEEVLDRARDGR